MINPYIYTTLTSMPAISPVLAEKHPWPVDIHEIPVSPNNIYHEVHGPASFGGIGGMFDGISVNSKMKHSSLYQIYTSMCFLGKSG